MLFPDAQKSRKWILGSTQRAQQYHIAFYKTFWWANLKCIGNVQIIFISWKHSFHRIIQYGGNFEIIKSESLILQMKVLRQSEIRCLWLISYMLRKEVSWLEILLPLCRMDSVIIYMYGKLTETVDNGNCRGGRRGNPNVLWIQSIKIYINSTIFPQPAMGAQILTVSIISRNFRFLSLRKCSGICKFIYVHWRL